MMDHESDVILLLSYTFLERPLQLFDLTCRKDGVVEIFEFFW